MLSTEFEWAAGSIVGRLHVGQNGLLRGQNNQDAFSLSVTPQALVAVVCDGCGSEAHSEFGARLGAELMASEVQRTLQRTRLPEEGATALLFWERVRQDVLAQLRVLGLSMAGAGSFTETIRSKFLFTVMVAVVTPEVTQVAAIGDGFYALNGNVQRIGPFPDNTPPYLCYGMIETEFSSRPELLRFQVPISVPTAAVHQLLVGSDGLADLMAAEHARIPGQREPFGPLRQFWEQDLFFRNRDSVRRRLALANSERIMIDRGTGSLVTHHALLPDDTTLAVVRRKQKEVSYGA